MARKVDDGRAVRVAVGASASIEKDNFVVLEGFLGIANYSIKTDAGGVVTEYKGQSVGIGGLATAVAEMVLNIESGDYETKQIKTDDVFARGDKIYWDDTNKYFTKTATDNIYAGKVTYADNTNDIIWFIFVPNIV